MFCPQCGSELPEGALSCSVCGTSVSASMPPIPAPAPKQTPSPAPAPAPQFTTPAGNNGKGTGHKGLIVLLVAAVVVALLAAAGIIAVLKLLPLGGGGSENTYEAVYLPSDYTQTVSYSSAETVVDYDYIRNERGDCTSANAVFYRYGDGAFETDMGSVFTYEYTGEGFLSGMTLSELVFGTDNVVRAPITNSFDEMGRPRSSVLSIPQAGFTVTAYYDYFDAETDRIKMITYIVTGAQDVGDIANLVNLLDVSGRYPGFGYGASVIVQQGASDDGAVFVARFDEDGQLLSVVSGDTAVHPYECELPKRDERKDQMHLHRDDGYETTTFFDENGSLSQSFTMYPSEGYETLSTYSYVLYENPSRGASMFGRLYE